MEAFLDEGEVHGDREDHMTPQERQLLTELFDRLASLETASRDPEAVAAISDGLKRAPNALYPLVQTALVQDEALKRADARIRELEDELGTGQEQSPGQGGFLDNMRGMLTGDRSSQGSVPNVRGDAAADHRANVWGPHANQPASYAPGPSAGYAPGPSAGYAPGQEQGPPGGGSFLGTAAAGAAGVVGGALLMNSLRGLLGGRGQGHGFGSGAGQSGTPWSQSGGGDLGRQAGLDDIGRGGKAAPGDGAQRAGLFDTAQNDADDSDSDSDSEDDDVEDDTDTA
jgi:hypothetical protein